MWLWWFQFFPVHDFGKMMALHRTQGESEGNFTAVSVTVTVNLVIHLNKGERGRLT